MHFDVFNNAKNETPISLKNKKGEEERERGVE
jgi:hypothetical protein